LCHCDNIPDPSNLKGGIIYSAHYFRGFSPWLLGPMQLDRTSWWQEGVEQELLHLMVNRKQRERKKDAQDKI
jgi:hypothetical protein